jgi:hypothetical protein
LATVNNAAFSNDVSRILRIRNDVLVTFHYKQNVPTFHDAGKHYKLITLGNKILLTFCLSNIFFVYY